MEEEGGVTEVGSSRALKAILITLCLTLSKIMGSLWGFEQTGNQDLISFEKGHSGCCIENCCGEGTEQSKVGSLGSCCSNPGERGRWPGPGREQGRDREVV